MLDLFICEKAVAQSSSVTWIVFPSPFRVKAFCTVSVHSFFKSAPVNPTVFLARTVKNSPVGLSDNHCEVWMVMMFLRPASSGRGKNSTLSNRPGRRMAGSTSASFKYVKYVRFRKNYEMALFKEGNTYSIRSPNDKNVTPLHRIN